jgi:LysM repeat protein
VSRRKPPPATRKAGGGLFWWFVIAVFIGVATQAGTGFSQAHSSGYRATIVVQPGDTLSSVAAATGVTVARLAAANGMSVQATLRAGQELVVPSAGGGAGPFAADAGPGPGAAAGVGTGDTTGLPGLLARSPDRLALRPLFVTWARAYGVDPPLVEAVCWMESGWQNDVTSPVGAMGIGQLMPITVDHMRSLIGAPLDPRVPGDNIRMSARLLAFLLTSTGNDVPEAVAGYAQGLSSVQANGPLPAVQHYVQVVLQLRGQFAAAR